MSFIFCAANEETDPRMEFDRSFSVTDGFQQWLCVAAAEVSVDFIDDYLK